MSSDRITPISEDEIQHRRRNLRRQRGFKSLRLGWQVFSAVGAIGFAIAIARQPDWVIRQPEQVQIDGNQFLRADTVRDFLPLSYPQSLLHLSPKEIAESLESQPPIAKATVRRQLFPPSLQIEVLERYPVALAYPSNAGNSGLPISTPSGAIDDRGVWIPWDTYRAVTPNLILPALKVRGDFEEYREVWSEVYQAIERSPATISEVDWQNRTNLILKTELGDVHIGPYSDRFVEQLQILDRMRTLPEQLDFSQVLYINLSDPDAPSVQMQPEHPPSTDPQNDPESSGKETTS
ncbi:FtsQ-type POTRA domain-containing protein [Oscillatoriales cyanobacterium LEGE 11467]|uniref:FtsQ-type POTRA domain-containing protein n=1 Tax=Zarconia navalis LEGE 11467 TaxID=1828826 RepID=A0A928VX72_9CYAN|nr:FtsQ-type POTRA domain-containing protein [Zarconia navalis]MBE9039916.1 FtsQ-type POTRA domain-containing protein [Zarconia navalis LEGE 11467]